MKLGISSYTYGWGVGVAGHEPASPLTALDLVDRAAELGVHLLQLCDNLPDATYADPHLAAVCARAQERSVSLEIGTRGTGPAHLGRFVEVARRARSALLRLVIDGPDDRPPLERVVARLRAMLPLLAEARVVLAIENHDRFAAAALRSVIDEVASPWVGACLDTANSFGALEGPAVVVETLGPCVANLHLKDFAVRRFPHAQGFTIEGRPAGHGMLDIPWLLGRLRALGRDPNVILEQWTPPEPTLDATIRKEAAWARQSVEAMRRWIAD